MMARKNIYILHITKLMLIIWGSPGRGKMKPQRSEITSRLVRFLDLDADGLRRFVLQSILASREFTVASLYEVISQRFNVSQKVVASMIGYICSRLGILHMIKKSYRSPRMYMLKEEYADLARLVLSI